MTTKHLYLSLGIVFLATLVAPGRSVAATPQSQKPVVISIPSINVGAKVEGLGVDKKGKMIAPKSAWSVAWFSGGVKPGDAGNAVMYGHINTTSSPTGIFARLKDVRIGDTIVVTDAAGTVRTFRVTKTAVYPVAKVPMDQLVGSTDARHLNLYTCAGTWSRLFGNYSHRLVVFSTLVSSSTLSQSLR